MLRRVEKQFFPIQRYLIFSSTMAVYSLSCSSPYKLTSIFILVLSSSSPYKVTSIFILLQAKDSQPKDDNLSDCAKTGYSGKEFITLGFSKCIV